MEFLGVYLLLVIKSGRSLQIPSIFLHCSSLMGAGAVLQKANLGHLGTIL